MMFSKSYNHSFIDMISEMHKMASPIRGGLFSPFPIIVSMNPSNPYIMFRASFRCINLIMHTYCAFHICHVLIVIFPFRCSVPSDRTRLRGEDQQLLWRILDPNGQVKHLSLKQYSGFLNQASTTSCLNLCFQNLYAPLHFIRFN